MRQAKYVVLATLNGTMTFVSLASLARYLSVSSQFCSTMLSSWRMKHSSTCLAVSISLLGRGKSPAVPLTSSSQCTCIWCVVENFGALRSHRPFFFFWRLRRACSYSHTCSFRWNVSELLTPELSRLGIEFPTIWFHEDGASAPTIRASMEVVREIFPEHVISLCGELSMI